MDTTNIIALISGAVIGAGSTAIWLRSRNRVKKEESRPPFGSSAAPQTASSNQWPPRRTTQEGTIDIAQPSKKTKGRPYSE